MKNLIKITIFICFAICAMIIPAHAEAPDVSAESCVLYCGDTDDVLYAKLADERRLIASTTKIMTAIIAIENLDMDKEIVIKDEWCGVEGSSMYLSPGQHYTVRELLTGMLLCSGNDAATAVAGLCTGGEEDFVSLMNAKAKELGMSNSCFSNPHGLDDENHYSTALDMAKLAAYCMKNEEFRNIVCKKSFTVNDLNFYNHNRLLSECDGCIGIKTGYTQAAGRTLVSCVQRNGLELICVTLNAPDDWNDHKKLYDWAYSEYSMTTFDSNVFSAYLPAISGVNSMAELAPEKTISVLSKCGQKVSAYLELPGMLFAGGSKGESVGEIYVYLDGTLAAAEKMVYTEDVPIDPNLKLSFIQRILRQSGSSQKPLYIKESAKISYGENPENYIRFGTLFPQNSGKIY